MTDQVFRIPTSRPVQPSPSRNRPNAADILVIVTDGFTDDVQRQVIPAANELKAAGVYIIPVGLFSGVGLRDLSALATMDQEVVVATSPTDLNLKVTELSELICRERVTRRKCSSRTTDFSRSCVKGSARVQKVCDLTFVILLLRPRRDKYLM